MLSNRPERIMWERYEGAFYILLLSCLSCIYIYTLRKSFKVPMPNIDQKFVIQLDTLERWNNLNKPRSSSQDSGNLWSSSQIDDYHYDSTKVEKYDDTPIVPSSKFRCPPHPPDWITIRSEVNYKYLWLHSNEKMWMGATATLDTPVHHKAFEVVPVNDDCSDGGWVRLREGDSKGFLYMVPPPTDEEEADPDSPPTPDRWVVRVGSEKLEDSKLDERYHFLLEEEGFMLNRKTLAFVNVIPNSDYAVRGHSSGWDKGHKAGREYSASMSLQFVNASVVESAIAKEEREEQEAEEEDGVLIRQIQKFPKSTEKRVISFGLYGSNPKYTAGAVKNAKMAKVYFPGWVCRFYVAEDVPKAVVEVLQEEGSEIIDIPKGKGYVSGMFWRFLVAVDESVDRYIIRDSDSRLNSRDAMAVQAWIESDYQIHIIRDHVNHCLPMNGGMWGGVKGALPELEKQVQAWENRDHYAADLKFLEDIVWPDIKDDKQLAHDSYCCDRYPNAKPFPTKRPSTYQHVGQVFDADDNVRLMDIDGFIRGVPVPAECRLRPEFIYG